MLPPGGFYRRGKLIHLLTDEEHEEGFVAKLTVKIITGYPDRTNARTHIFNIG